MCVCVFVAFVVNPTHTFSIYAQSSAFCFHHFSPLKTKTKKKHKKWFPTFQQNTDRDPNEFSSIQIFSLIELKIFFFTKANFKLNFCTQYTFYLIRNGIYQNMSAISFFKALKETASVT